MVTHGGGARKTDGGCWRAIIRIHLQIAFDTFLYTIFSASHRGTPERALQRVVKIAGAKLPPPDDNGLHNIGPPASQLDPVLPTE
jgi:hypothetical protein